MTCPRQGDPAQPGLAVGEQCGGRAGGLGEPEEQFEVGQDRDRVLALHHRVRPQGRPQPAHRGDRARPGTGHRADGEAERGVRQRQRVVPVAAAARTRAVQRGELHTGHAGEPGRQQLLGDGRHARARALDFEEPRQVLGGETGVQAGEMALPLDRLGGLVVEPHGGAQPSGRVGRQGQRVTRRVAQAYGHLAVARVEAVLGEQVGVDDLAALAARGSVQNLAVGHRPARDGLDVAEVGAAEAQADGGVRAEAVAGFQDDESAPGAHESGSGAQQFLECVRECVRAGQAFREFMQGREVGDPAGETVLEQGTWRVRSGFRRILDVRGRGRRGTGGGRRGRDSVCGRGNR